MALNERDCVYLVGFEKTHPDAKLPTKNNYNDSGMDVYSVEEKLIPARGSAIVNVGLKFSYIPPYKWIKVEGRSGLGFKHGIIPHPGIIDNGYRGDAGIKLYNNTDVDYTVQAGDRIAQFVMYDLYFTVAEWRDTENTTRGEKGFGSSGK